MNGSRFLLLAAVLALGGFVAWAALAPPPDETPPPTAESENADGTGTTPGETDPAVGIPAPRGEGLVFSHPSDCAECHPRVYDEWAGSMHARAWTDPEVRALSDDFAMTECLSCHVPQPIHFSPVGERVFERASRHETGVDCLSCHLLPDGGVAANRDIPDAPCRPRAVATLSDAVSCKGCHNQHWLYDDWKALFHEPDPEKGALLTEGRPESCNDCHMPPREGPDGVARRTHGFPGGRDVEMHRAALGFEARVEDGAVVVETTNAAVGHRAPADSRHRSFNVWVTVETEGGVRVADRREIAEYRMYYRYPPRENTNLRPGETATARLPLPTGETGTVKVELVYAFSPPKKEARDVLVVHVRTLSF